MRGVFPPNPQARSLTEKMTNFASDNPAPASYRSIYERAAYNGLWMGIYFTILFLAMVGAMRFGLLNIVVFTMVLLVPYLVYIQLRKTHYEAHGLESFSGLWMQGILTFGCGSIIFCATSYIFLRWIYPGFMPDTLRLAIELYEEQPGDAAADLAAELRAVLDRKMYPNASTISIMWLWFGTFSGSILSMVVATIVRMLKIKR